MQSKVLSRAAGVLAVVGLTLPFTTVQSSAHPSAMVTGGLTSQPIGHYEFCKRYREECSIRPAEAELQPVSRPFLDRLQVITAEVNKSVRPVSDLELYGRDEFWTYPKDAGDCEEYVLQKQRVLSSQGVSRANLLITVVRKPDREGHAVLTVRTDGGDFILDNLNDRVTPWDETGYTFLKRQASDHTGRWVSIKDGHEEPLVSALD